MNHSVTKQVGRRYFYLDLVLKNFPPSRSSHFPAPHIQMYSTVQSQPSSVLSAHVRQTAGRWDCSNSSPASVSGFVAVLFVVAVEYISDVVVPSAAAVVADLAAAVYSPDDSWFIHCYTRTAGFKDLRTRRFIIFNRKVQIKDKGTFFFSSF